MGNCCRGGGGRRTSDVEIQERGADMEGASPIQPQNDSRVMAMAQLEPHNGTGQEEEPDEVEVTALQHIADREGTYGLILLHTPLIRFPLALCRLVGVLVL